MGKGRAMVAQVVTNIVTFLMGLGLIIYAEALPKVVMAGTKEFIGPSFFPRIIGIVLSLLSLIHLLSFLPIIRNKDQKLSIGSESTRVKTPMTNIYILLITIGLLIMAIIFIPVLGFYITILIYVFLKLILLWKKNDKYKYIASIIISTGLVLLIYLLFERLLWVVPPRGILF